MSQGVLGDGALGSGMVGDRALGSGMVSDEVVGEGNKSVMEPVSSAPSHVQKLIKRVLELEKEKLHNQRPRGINDDVLKIIKEEVQ